MVIDTSALIAILQAEPEADGFVIPPVSTLAIAFKGRDFELTDIARLEVRF